MDGIVRYPASWTPSPTFSNDINLMDYMEQQKVDHHIITMFNTCRLYKKVYHLGDLLDPSGARLRPGALLVKTRQYYDDKFPDVHLPARDPQYSEVWTTYIRQIMQSKPKGTTLGHLISRRSYEWSLNGSKTLLIRYQQGIPVSVHDLQPDGTYSTHPNQDT